MAFIYITEHRLPKVYVGNLVPAVSMPPLATQKKANDGATVASAAFNAATQLIAIHTDSICSIEFSATPGATTAATTASRRLAANATEYFEVRPGDIVSVILNT